MRYYKMTICNSSTDYDMIDIRYDIEIELSKKQSKSTNSSLSQDGLLPK